MTSISTRKMIDATTIRDLFSQLAAPDEQSRRQAAQMLFDLGRALSRETIEQWVKDAGFHALLATDENSPRTTVGVAVTPELFQRIRTANGDPKLANVPPDQDAIEFELHFARISSAGKDSAGSNVRLDILTTKNPAGEGAIANFLKKFGDGIQQVEYEVSNTDAATKILADKFAQKSIYPATRPGADGTRVNFFLVSTSGGKKILVELVESAR
jgi:TusA-related sulfurtransferase